MIVEELKNTFRYDLIGRWTSSEGSFNNITNEVWEFEANGNGRTISNSILSGSYKEEFKWRRKDLYCIELSIIDTECNEQGMWREIHYDFCLVPSDNGYLSVLVEVDKKTGTKRNGFGIMEVPLSYVSHV